MAAIPVTGKSTFVQPGGDVLHFNAEVGTANWWEIEDEGITWLRGHHAEDSEAVAACRVAYALVGSKSWDAFAS